MRTLRDPDTRHIATKTAVTVGIFSSVTLSHLGFPDLATIVGVGASVVWIWFPQFGPGDDDINPPSH